MNLRTYITLENKLIGRLQTDWARRSTPIYAEIANLCRQQEWDKARLLVSELDLTETGQANREWIKYLLLAFGIWGAKIATPKSPSIMGLGFEKLLTQTTNNMLAWLEHGGTAQVQEEALQLIATDEQAYTVQKWDESQHPRDKDGKFALSAASRDALDAYGFSRRAWMLNRMLRDGNPLDGPEARLVTALDDLMRPEPAQVVHRVTDAALVQDLQVGDTFTDAGYSSTSPSSELTQFREGSRWGYEGSRQQLIIQVPDQYPRINTARYPAGPYISMQPLEGEVILPRGTTFRVVSKDPLVVAVVPTQKADKSGRYITPFVDFSNQGEAQLQLIASLNASRLATWGFTAEAEIRGFQKYKLTNVLDGRTSKFCWMMAGKTFNVADARTKVIEVLNVQDANDLKNIQPWPKQTKASLEAYRVMTPEELTALGLHIPPFHPRCRTICVPVEEDFPIPPPPLDKVPETVPVQMATRETMKELGISLTDKEIEHWNTHVGTDPTKVLSLLSGQTPLEVLTKKTSQIAVMENGVVTMSNSGVVRDVKYAVSTALDPYSGTYYLTQADLVVGKSGAETQVLKRLYSGLMEAGQAVNAKSLVAQVSGNVAAYVTMGFLPSQEVWERLRAKALALLSEEPSFLKLTNDQQMSVMHLLQNTHPQSLNTLMNLDISVGKKQIGHFLFDDAQELFGIPITEHTIQAMKGAFE